MGEPRGFLAIERHEPGYRPVAERLRDFNEVELRPGEDAVREQAARCMDCGIPFCHGCGCPLCNVVPEVNELVYNGHWDEAFKIISATNNFPEFTGRICPAPCEAACTVGLDAEAVTIRQIELAVAERAFADGLLVPRPPLERNGKKVAVIGSGPAGLAVADQLNKTGCLVTVYERDEAAGGLLRYGIPDFKLDKKIVQRRIQLMTDEGVEFENGVDVGNDVSAQFLLKRFDAVCLAVGSRGPRDLPVPGRGLKGVHFAMDFLWQQNCLVSGQEFCQAGISAKDKSVVVIGGGDTGSDCVGTSLRQGAKSVTQIEIMPKPPDERDPGTPWPMWPYQLRTSSSHGEGCGRRWNIMTKEFLGTDRVTGLKITEVEWEKSQDGKLVGPIEKDGSETIVEADMVLLAMGFTGPESGGVIDQFELEIDDRGNIAADQSGKTGVPGVFAAGDAVSGASLVVRAIDSGRNVAEAISGYLLKS